MAEYEVAFWHSMVNAPNEFSHHVAYWSIFDVPDSLSGRALLDYIEAELLQCIGGIGRVRELRIIRGG